VPGFNITGVTTELAVAHTTALPLLLAWKPFGVTALETYDPLSGTMQRAELDVNGNPSGVDFLLHENSALHVYSSQHNSLSLGISNSCSPLNLGAGFNLASYACFPAIYPVSQFITSAGLSNITSISRLDPSSGRWQTAAVDGGAIVGDDFNLVAGEGYLVQSAAVVSGWTAPSAAVITMTPTSMPVWQGQPLAELTISIPGPAPAGGTAIDLVSSDATLVVVAAQAIIGQGNTTVVVPLTLPDTGIVAEQSVTVTASGTGMNSASSVLSVLPKPTVNLSPLSTLTGLTFTYLLNVNLSDAAPPGGLPVSLAAVPSTIVNVPASVTIPAGASSTQVTVTATAVGSAVITATSPGRAISGSQNSVTVTPIQTMNYGPLVSANLGIQVGPTAGPTSSSVNYGPVVSREVGVVVGSIFTGISPNRGAVGTTALSVTIYGSGLDAATGVSFLPSDGITVGTLTVASDGLSATVMLDIAANAPISDRTLLLATAAGNIKPVGAGADIFKVTNLAPQIQSLNPISAITGSTMSLQLNGRQFLNGTSISFNPPDGIAVGNPPAISSDGTTATVTITIDPAAPTTVRVVTITTPAGDSSSVADVSNSFQIKPPATVNTLYPQYTPLLSTELGVMVTIPAVNSLNVMYGPTVSQPLGVTVGSTITAITPVSGAIGTTSLKVRALGVGLSSATALSFYPTDGITIQAGSFAIGSDGNPEVIVDISSNAPVAPRTVLVALPSGYAVPTDAGSDMFRVTLPQPEIASVHPLRAMVGQNVTMTIYGKNFGSASSVDFTPPGGISVSNPPTVSSDGTMITVSLIIDASAPLGNRVVSVTTPAGTTAAAATTANSFTITADLGTTYVPLISSEVGVLVTEAAVSNQVNVMYGPIASGELGIMVTPAPSAAPLVTYEPVVSNVLGVAVGGIFTGFSPAAIEPGSTSVFTLTGSGLDAVTAIAVLPATNLTVTAWTPASDGLSGTVSIQADLAAGAGLRTLLPMVGSISLPPSAAGIDILQIGYKPVASSITTTFPASSVTVTSGTTVTLTMNGTHLQGVTKVEVLPSDGVTVDTMPTWSSDGTGEHVSVKIVVDATAAASDRLVRLTTTYGSSSAIPDTTNTLSIFKP